MNKYKMIFSDALNSLIPSKFDLSVGLFVIIFSTRQHICYSALYAIGRPSVCPSHGSISQKRLKLGSCNFHCKVAPWLVSLWLISQRNSKGNIGSGDAK